MPLSWGPILGWRLEQTGESEPTFRGELLRLIHLTAQNDGRAVWDLMSTRRAGRPLVSLIVESLLYEYSTLADEFTGVPTPYAEAQAKGYTFLAPDLDAAVDAAESDLGPCEVEETLDVRIYRWPSGEVLAFESALSCRMLWRDCTARIAAQETTDRPGCVAQDPFGEAAESLLVASDPGGGTQSKALSGPAALGPLEGDLTVWEALAQAKSGPPAGRPMCASCAGGVEFGPHHKEPGTGYIHWAHPECVEREVKSLSGPYGTPDLMRTELDAAGIKTTGRESLHRLSQLVLAHRKESALRTGEWLTDAKPVNGRKDHECALCGDAIGAKTQHLSAGGRKRAHIECAEGRTT